MVARKGRCLRCNTRNSSQWLFDTLQLCIILQPPILLLQALCPYYMNQIHVIDLSWNDSELVYRYFACVFMYMIVKLHCIYSVVSLVLISPNCCISRPGFSSKNKWVLLSALRGVMGIMATMDVIIFTSITHRHASPWYLHEYTISEDSLRRSISGSDHTETKAYTCSIPVWSLLKKLYFADMEGSLQSELDNISYLTAH